MNTRLDDIASIPTELVFLNQVNFFLQIRCRLIFDASKTSWTQDQERVRGEGKGVLCGDGMMGVAIEE